MVGKAEKFFGLVLRVERNPLIFYQEAQEGRKFLAGTFI
jgi:hypothetical protein